MASVIDVGVSDLKQVVEEIKEMNPVDFIFLIKQINKYSLSSIPVVYYECNYCGGHTASRGYPFRPEIFLPLNN